MTILEVLTLMLVVFSILSLLEDRIENSSKKETQTFQ